MLKVCWWYFELFYQRLLKMMHCHILSMSSFPPTADIHNLEYSYIIIHNHVRCYFASNSLMSLCSTRMHIKKVLPVASCYYFHNVWVFFLLFLSLCIFCPISVCLDLHLLSWSFCLEVLWKKNQIHILCAYSTYISVHN